MLVDIVVYASLREGCSKCWINTSSDGCRPMCGENVFQIAASGWRSAQDLRRSLRARLFKHNHNRGIRKNLTVLQIEITFSK